MPRSDDLSKWRAWKITFRISSDLLRKYSLDSSEFMDATELLYGFCSIRGIGRYNTMISPTTSQMRLRSKLPAQAF